MVGSDFLSDAEVDGYVNAAAAELWDLRCGLYEDEYTERVEIPAATSGPLDISDMSTLAGLLIPLGSEADRLLKLRRLEYRDGAGKWRTLQRIDLGEWDAFNTSPARGWPIAYSLIGASIYILPEGGPTHLYRIWYVPAFRALTGDASTLDGLDYWHEYVVVDAAIRCLQKEESDVSVLMAQKQALKQRIVSIAAGRDASGPAHILDVDSDSPGGPWWSR